MSWAQLIVDNLNRNLMLEHIEYVEKGIYPVDNDYKKFKKIEKHLKTLESYIRWKKSEKK